MTNTNDDALLTDIHNFLIFQARRGDKMDTETELAKRFQVSRYRVRLVLDKLSQMGVITRAQKRGLTLDNVSTAKLAENFGTQFSLAGFDLREFLESRIALANEMAPLVAMRATPASLGTLEKLLSQMEGAMLAKSAVLSFHQEFQETLYKASGNRVLEVYALALEKVWQGYLKDLKEFDPKMIEAAVDADREALKSLRIGDARRLSETLSRMLRDEMLYLIEH